MKGKSPQKKVRNKMRRAGSKGSRHKKERKSVINKRALIREVNQLDEGIRRLQETLELLRKKLKQLKW